MALPIAPTPVLKGEDAKRFFKEVEEGLKKPAKLTPTPKLNDAKELIRKHALDRKKQHL